MEDLVNAIQGLDVETNSSMHLYDAERKETILCMRGCTGVTGCDDTVKQPSPYEVAKAKVGIDSNIKEMVDKTFTFPCSKESDIESCNRTMKEVAKKFQEAGFIAQIRNCYAIYRHVVKPDCVNKVIEDLNNQLREYDEQQDDYSDYGDNDEDYEDPSRLYTNETSIPHDCIEKQVVSIWPGNVRVCLPIDFELS